MLAIITWFFGKKMLAAGGEHEYSVTIQHIERTCHCRGLALLSLAMMSSLLKSFELTTITHEGIIEP